MPVRGCNKYARVCSVHRTIEYRLLPGSKSNANKLGAIAGACRFVWNAILAQCIQEYKQARESPSVKYFFPLGKRFKEGNYIAEYPRVLAPVILRCGGVVRMACASFSQSVPAFREKPAIISKTSANGYSAI